VELVDAEELDVLEVGGLGGIAVDLPRGGDGVAHVNDRVNGVVETGLDR